MSEAALRATDCARPPDPAPKDMRIKKSSPKHRKSFRARHHCDTNPGPKWKGEPQAQCPQLWCSHSYSALLVVQEVVGAIVDMM